VVQAGSADLRRADVAACRAALAEVVIAAAIDPVGPISASRAWKSGVGEEDDASIEVGRACAAS
jgi:hypothetical protein